LGEWTKQQKDGLEGERNLTKKKSSLALNIISTFSGIYVPYNKNDHHEKQFEKDLVLCIAKKLVPLLVVEATFFRRLIIRQNP
jgi:hypothetical protein